MKIIRYEGHKFYFIALLTAMCMICANCYGLAVRSLCDEENEEYLISVFFSSFYSDMGAHEGPFEGGYPRQFVKFVKDALESIKSQSGPHIVDLGAGDLWLTKKVFEAVPGARVEAVDINEPAKAIPDGIRFTQASIEATGFPEASFDVVMSAFTICYARKDIAVREIYRIMKPNARAIILMHARGSELMSGLFARQRTIYERLEMIKDQSSREKEAKLLGIKLRAIRAVLTRLYENSFRYEDEVRRFYESKGFCVQVKVFYKYADVEILFDPTLKDEPPMAFGVILTKVNDVNERHYLDGVASSL